MSRHSVDNGPDKPDHLRCEYMTNPLGIEEGHPRLSWFVSDPRRNAVQSAYHVLVASSEQKLASDEGDIWDSGKVASDQSSHVEYEGPELKSRQRCYWKVRTWDGCDSPSPWSDIQWWEMGILSRGDWMASWIGWDTPVTKETEGRAVYLRRTFTIDKTVESARVYASARGIYEVFINGHRVSDDVFRPGWTEYDHRIQYQTYDVTDLLRKGENVIAAVIGDGWYCGRIAWLGRGFYGPKPSFLAQLEADFPDGTSKGIVTDESWRVCGDGPIRFACFFDGERYDARHEMPGWNDVDFNDEAWLAPDIEPLTPGLLAAQVGPSVRRVMELPAVDISEPVEGAHIFDLGQNIAGWARLKVSGLAAGTELKLRFAEILDKNGNVYMGNLPRAECTDCYTTKGDAEEIWEPAFTSHGFRYVELTGYPGRPPKDIITGVVLHSDMPVTGRFSCSNDLVNKLQSNIARTQRGNFVEIPTDCPQRGERLGWASDIGAYYRTACFNMDTSSFFTRWMADWRSTQREDGALPDVVPNIFIHDPDTKLYTRRGTPGEGDTGVTIPWNMYLHYGDTRILERQYDVMKKWIAHCEEKSEGLICPRVGYGDWLNHFAFTPLEIITTAYFAQSTRIVSRVAGILGKKDDQAKYEELFERIKAAFIKEFVSPSGRVFGNTQTAYLFAIQYDLLPDDLRPKAVQYLVDDIRKGRYWVEPNEIRMREGYLSTGMMGVQYICEVLTKNGRADVAYQLLLNEDCPSWLFLVKQGATTIWERWDAVKPNGEMVREYDLMNSLNHYALGAVGNWLYSMVAGIGIDENCPGYKKVVIHPHPLIGSNDVTSARGEYESVYGQIVSEWSIQKDRFVLKVVLPPNTSGTVWLPTSNPGAVTECGLPLEKAEGVTEIAKVDSEVVCEIGSGQYEFEVDLADA